MKRKKKYSDEQLISAVRQNLSIAGVCRALNIRPIGGNYKTINLSIKELDIDISHFTGKAWNVGIRYQSPAKQKLEDVLVEKSTYRSSTKLKRRLIIEGLKEEKCEECLLSEWLNKKIPLELHHKNGNNMDNRLENIQLLCPNCHAQTDTYRSKNRTSVLSELRADEFINSSSTESDKTITTKVKKNIKEKNVKVKTKCLNCEKECRRTDTLYCCLDCYKEARKNVSSVPKVPELLSAFKELKSFVQVGKKFGVSDNAVRKWCKNYGIMNMVNQV